MEVEENCRFAGRMLQGGLFIAYVPFLRQLCLWRAGYIQLLDVVCVDLIITQLNSY